MKYQVIRTPHLHELEAKVNELTAEGWEPQGGITVAGNVMMQAMVSDEDEREFERSMAEAECRANMDVMGKNLEKLENEK